MILVSMGHHATQRPSVIERTLRDSADAWDGKSHIFDLCPRGVSRANFLEFIVVPPLEVIGTVRIPVFRSRTFRGKQALCIIATQIHGRRFAAA